MCIRDSFNAAVAKITFSGRNVHPGYAKHKMINSIRIANQFAIMLPRWETPEHTEGYEGFYHLISIEGTVEKTVLTYIIRDHDRDRFERRKKEFEHLTRKINHEFPGVASLEIKDQYYNMREKIEPVMHIIDIAEEAMRRAGAVSYTHLDVYKRQVSDDSLLRARVERATLPILYSELEIARTEPHKDAADLTAKLNRLDSLCALYRVDALNERTNSPSEYLSLIHI